MRRRQLADTAGVLHERLCRRVLGEGHAVASAQGHCVLRSVLHGHHRRLGAQQHFPELHVAVLAEASGAVVSAKFLYPGEAGDDPVAQAGAGAGGHPRHL